jgi:NAD(P)-dependent dehydrogenase (short-subunit alcohol dehydrogenase family)
MDLKNKIVVITGGTSGLGKALAVCLLKEQAKVVINSRSKSEVQNVAKEIGAIGCIGDVTREKDMQKLAAFTFKKFGRIDIWINNAGISIPNNLPIEKIDAKKAHTVMEVNFFGTFYGSRSAMKIMKRQRHGTILNIVSMSSLFGRPLSSAYSSSKWAVRGFTEALRMALKPNNISTIAIHPGGIKTDIFGKFKPAGYDKWMEPSYVAEKIIRNLKLSKPKEEIIIKKK